MALDAQVRVVESGDERLNRLPRLAIGASGAQRLGRAPVELSRVDPTPLAHPVEVGVRHAHVALEKGVVREPPFAIERQSRIDRGAQNEEDRHSGEEARHGC
ncbi:MAG: hypothetical protein ABR527_01535 [Gemmatimonadota bacterium]